MGTLQQRFFVRRHPDSIMALANARIGSCALCGRQAAKAKMAAHLAACLAAHGGAERIQALVLYRFEAAYDSRYWLYAEARANASLRHLDAFLRKIWLECCGHLSAFYADHQQLGMGAVANLVFGARGAKIRYEYDFGSTTTLTGQAVSVHHGAKGREVVRLLARNAPLEEPCTQCAEPATVVCPYCLEGGAALLCATHAGTHEHADEGVYLPVINSPRMGVCGYIG